MNIVSTETLSMHSSYRRGVKTLLPPESLFFNETIETYVKYVQGANAFIVMFVLYELFKFTYLQSIHKNDCTGSSSTIALASIAGLNILWMIITLIGIASINSRRTSNVSKYMYLLLANGILRGLFYFGINKKMNFLTNEGRLSCGSIYQGDTYLMQAALEILAIVILLFLTRSIKKYMRAWDEAQYLEDY